MSDHLNPLRAPPFYIIPGINPDDPISAQMEQIDQLNTLLLQDIDHNFARFHQVITSKLLPEIKRYALASEPTREASKFWRSFFEAAAAVKVPVPGEFTATEMDDESGMQEGGGDLQHQASSNVQDGDEDGEEDASQEDLSISSEDHSFLYGNPVSSTPLAKKSHKHQKGGNAHHHHAPPSMDSPADSPFEMLDRKLKEKLQFSDDIDDGDDRGISSLGDTPSLPSGYDDYSGRIQQRSSYDDYEEEPSVLISRQDLPAAAAAPSSQEDKSASATPKAATAKKASAAASKVPAATTTTTTAAASPARNPFTKGNERWNGIADLRNAPLNPKIRRPPSAKKSIPPPPGTNFDITDTFDDEPEEDFALGMSPPVTMNFGIPGAGGGGGIQKFSRTPAKEATKLIIDDLMKEMSGLSPSPGVPTPPAFARYANYENLSAAASPSFSRSRKDVGDEQGEEDELTIQQGGDVGGDSFEEEGASTVGMGRRGVPTESFVDDESFEGSERSTLDILRRSGPAATNQHDLMAFSPASSEAASVFGGPKSYRSQGFALMRQDEMETYHGGRLEDAGLSPRLSPSYGLAKSLGNRNKGQ